MEEVRSVGTPLFVLRGHQSPIHTIRHIHSQHVEQGLVVSGDQVGEVRLWNLRTRRCIWKHSVSGNPEGIVHAEGSESQLWVQNRDAVSSWDVNQSSQVVRIETLSSSFARILFLDKERSTFISPGQEPGEVLLFDARIPSKPCLHFGDSEVEKVKGTCTFLTRAGGSFGQFSTGFVDEHNVFLGWEDGTVSLWDKRNMSCSMTEIQCQKLPVLTMTASKLASGFGVVCGGPGSRFSASTFFEKEDRWSASVYRHVKVPYGGIAEFQTSTDGSVFAGACWDHT